MNRSSKRIKAFDINKTIEQFIKSSNAFDVAAALALFAGNAVIDDVSVGEKFKHTAGVRKYLKTFFVGYKTETKLMSIKVVDNLNANAEADFTGDFGHKTGALNFTLNEDGLIGSIDADLDEMASL